MKWSRLSNPNRTRHGAAGVGKLSWGCLGWNPAKPVHRSCTPLFALLHCFHVCLWVLSFKCYISEPCGTLPSHILTRDFDHLSWLFWSPTSWILNRCRRMIPLTWTNMSAISLDIIDIIPFWMFWNIMKVYICASYLAVISSFKSQAIQRVIWEGVLLQHWIENIIRISTVLQDKTTSSLRHFC